ncbi:hypothetical protein HOY82DRAFT_543964 [Tuber indicum]|nr:hypothetical protein HOY82DRAFT_543964 [Tuber indicum]
MPLPEIDGLELHDRSGVLETPGPDVCSPPGRDVGQDDTGYSTHGKLDAQNGDHLPTGAISSPASVPSAQVHPGTTDSGVTGCGSVSGGNGEPSGYDSTGPGRPGRDPPSNDTGHNRQRSPPEDPGYPRGRSASPGSSARYPRLRDCYRPTYHPPSPRRRDSRGRRESLQDHYYSNDYSAGGRHDRRHSDLGQRARSRDHLRRPDSAGPSSIYPDRYPRKLNYHHRRRARSGDHYHPRSRSPNYPRESYPRHHRSRRSRSRSRSPQDFRDSPRPSRRWDDEPPEDNHRTATHGGFTEDMYD